MVDGLTDPVLLPSPDLGKSHERLVLTSHGDLAELQGVLPQLLGQANDDL
jgi:hypothetical protein